MNPKVKMATLITTGSVLAAGAGVLGAIAATGASNQNPTTTTTINAAVGITGPTGPAGPAGPTGPAGPSGVENCPAGSEFGEVVINHPGGHVTFLTCIVG